MSQRGDQLQPCPTASVPQQSGDLQMEMGNVQGLTVDIGSGIMMPSKSMVSPRSKMSPRLLNILTNFARLLPLVAAFGMFVYLIIIIATPSNWRTNEDATSSEINARTKARGTFVSMLCAVLITVVGGFLFSIRVREGLVVINYGFILAPVVGYLLDQAIGSDAGFANIGKWKGFTYAMSQLIAGDFFRYLITILLDLFISNPLQDVMKRQARRVGVIEELVKTEDKSPRMRKYDDLLALNFPTLLLSITQFLTYNAYTNETRFSWAYPEPDVDREDRISPGTIMLVTASAGVMYLIFYTVMDTFSDRGYYAVNTKMIYVLVTLLLLFGLHTTGSMEAPVEGEDYVSYTDWMGEAQAYFGMMFFSCFVCYGLVYPIYTRLGCNCCGKKFMPSKEEIEVNDHIMNEEKNPISNHFVDALHKRLASSNQLHSGKSY